MVVEMGLVREILSAREFAVGGVCSVGGGWGSACSGSRSRTVFEWGERFLEKHLMLENAVIHYPSKHHT